MIRRLLIHLSWVASATAQIPAFPGAEGYGAYAVGGRAGDVYHVTNLNASGAGSFAEAISTVPSAGRTVVFDVSGYIRLPSGSNGTRMTASKVTIAGQTAPGDGVGFYNNFFRISGDDVVIRHLRFRHGKYGSGGDCIDLDSGCLNAVLDHVSMQFSTDENMSSFGSPPENLTLQYSLNAWGLETHSCGGLWDQNHATSHHNLWAHNHTRNPKARPGGLLEWVNNVTYDWDIGFIMGDSQSNQNWKVNVLNNYFLCPPGNTHGKALVKGTVGDNGKPNFTVFLNGNLSDYDGDGSLNGTDKGYSIVEGTAYAPGASGLTPGAAGYYQATAAIAGSTAGVATDSPLLAYKKIISNAGALRMDAGYTGTIRDEVDTILIGKLTTQSPFHVTRESDTGASNSGFGTLNSSSAPVDTDRDGMPDYYETALTWNPAAQDHNTALANSGGLITGMTFFPNGTVAGYTRLEEYLHFLAMPHGTVAKNISGTPSSIQVDLRKYTSGFTVSPSFAVSAVANGTTAQYLADGVTPSTTGPIVKFTPTLNFVGRGRFEFTVSDAAGSSWTQTMAMLVAQSGLPRDLSWKGDGTANLWDDVSNNWLGNGAATTFSFGDRVNFDDNGSKSPAVSVPGTVSPTTMEVNAVGNYTFGGAGSISSSGALTKRGTGTLTINNTGANSFSAISLDAGSLVLNNATAGGSGKISFNGGSLTATPSSNAVIPNALEFNTASSLTVGSQHTQTGNWTGSQVVTVNATSAQLWTIAGTWTGFTGRLVAGTGNPRFRINGNTNTNFGSASVAVDLGNGTAQLMNRNGATIEIGELSSTGSGTGLSGTQTGTAASTYNIGGRNTDATFAGVISNGGGTNNITKVGGGTWTLSGASTHTGATSVSAGGLLVDGSLGNTAVSVASGALLGGDGSIGGSVTANAGAILSPGTIPFTGAPLAITGGLALNGNTLYYDMSNSPTGANDRIDVGGTLALTGTQVFQFVLLNGPLAAGTYDLINAGNSSASGVSLTHNLPTDSRQTFAVNRSAAGSTPSKVWLTVTGNPATLTWTGTASGTWDTATANNWTGASPNTFYNNDDVWFDDSSTVNTVNIPSAVAPRMVTFNNSTRAYTLGGAAGVSSGALVKNGAGALTLTGTNSPSTTTINSGATITLANDTANAGALGSGLITFNGGTITMYDNQSGFSSSTLNLLVPSGQTGTLNADSRHTFRGTLSGSGTLNFRVPWIRSDLDCDWSAFSGTLNVTTDADRGDLRMITNYYFPGFPQATVNLADRVWAYYNGILSEGGGTTIEIGELSGSSLSGLKGGPTGGRNFTYRIGGKTLAGAGVTFAGTIAEQNTGTATSIVKTGAGIWTLSGSGAWNGGTTIEQGTLRLTGPFSCAGATGVNSGATLKLEGGSLASDAVHIAAGAVISGYGALNGDLNVDGTCETRGFVSGTPGSLVVTGNLFLSSGAVVRMRGGVGSDLVAVTGDIALGGTLQVSLAPGSSFGRYPLIISTGAISGSIALTGVPAGTTAQFSTSIAGRVDLVIDDNDEDGLPDSWEIANFGNLTQTPAGDKDGDGSSNLVEYRLGLNPNSGASGFSSTVNGHTITWPSASGIVFTVKRSVSLQGDWQILGTVTGGAGPTASFTDPSSFSRAFYKIEFNP